MTLDQAHRDALDRLYDQPVHLGDGGLDWDVFHALERAHLALLMQGRVHITEAGARAVERFRASTDVTEGERGIVRARTTDVELQGTSE